MKAVDIARSHPDECSTCGGYGQTDETATRMGHDKRGRLITLKRGSGCPRCGGIGRIIPQEKK